ncbi:MAG: hypothetical protein BWZ10_02211 [candidate division BRC1 bacterium ADurb.BinA364]|nr:MAG: hypothetical protein BWZ10_02211 [candidate division BRC1 bacterium ADurb.BinA364]
MATVDIVILALRMAVARDWLGGAGSPSEMTTICLIEALDFFSAS